MSPMQRSNTAAVIVLSRSTQVGVTVRACSEVTTKEPIVLLAFAVRPVMWFFQRGLLAMIMPKYWILSAVDRTWPSMEYKWIGVTLLFVIDIM